MAAAVAAVKAASVWEEGQRQQYYEGEEKEKQRTSFNENERERGTGGSRREAGQDAVSLQWGGASAATTAAATTTSVGLAGKKGMRQQQAQWGEDDRPPSPSPARPPTTGVGHTRHHLRGPAFLL